MLDPMGGEGREGQDIRLWDSSGTAGGVPEYHGVQNDVGASYEKLEQFKF